jgi:hypothetical protein
VQCVDKWNGKGRINYSITVGAPLTESRTDFSVPESRYWSSTRMLSQERRGLKKAKRELRQRLKAFQILVVLRHMVGSMRMKPATHLLYKLFAEIIRQPSSNENVTVMRNISTTRPPKNYPTPSILAGDGTCCIYLDLTHFCGPCQSVTQQVMAGGGKFPRSGCKLQKKLPEGEKPTLTLLPIMNQMSICGEAMLMIWSQDGKRECQCRHWIDQGIGRKRGRREISTRAKMMRVIITKWALMEKGMNPGGINLQGLEIEGMKMDGGNGNDGTIA